jgi:CubicO group peptidase (beta-lactamase class C family)
VSASEGYARELDRLLAERQADRLPSVAAAVVRDGDIVWANAVGAASYQDGVDATPDHQYRIGSITKTFTATAIMQLRDAGELDLDDRLELHLPDVANGSPTIRRMLSHLSGLQREAGEMWITGEVPTEDALRVDFALDPAKSFHYSNLAFGLLGRVVSAKSGVEYTTYVNERIIGPLGLRRTTWEPKGKVASGYLVSEYARTVWDEEVSDLGLTASAGALWSTVEDLARWATFLAKGDERVLDAATVESMWFPQAMYYPDSWAVGWGLGLQLINSDGRIWGGHGGAMAGYLAGVYVDRKTGTGAAALTNNGVRGDLDVFCVKLAAKSLELWPPSFEPWRPEEEPPAEVHGLLGRWWSEGNEFIFWWEGGKLRAKFVGAQSGRGESTFERNGEQWVVSEGREIGETLRVDGDRLVWAGYAFTRDQLPFSAL